MKVQTGKLNYGNCGRKRTMTKAAVAWMISQLRALRPKGPATSQMLQRLLAKKKKIVVEASTVRRHLKANGYKWQLRVKKTKYSAVQRTQRADHVDDILKRGLTALDMCMDGVVLTRPPQQLVARENYVFTDITHCWRKDSERDLPECQGFDQYKKQVPPSRQLPLWGGISAGGYATIFFHPHRKTDAEEWSTMVDRGDLLQALRSINPGRRRGAKSWLILCDNESFLRADESKAAYRKHKIRLFEKLPAKSPDLNPVERFWAWLRRTLNRMDLADLVNKRPVPGRMAYKQRVVRLLKTDKAQTVAKNIFKGHKKVCKAIKKSRGMAYH